MSTASVLPRRDFLLGAAALSISACARAKAPTAEIAAIEAKLGGRLGLSAIDTGSGEQIRFRADERFAMASTFKLALVGAVLTKIDAGAVKRSDVLKYGPADLLDYAPVTRAHVSEGGMSVEALCAAAVSLSDNTAANLLLNLVGGPAALTAFLRARGDQVTRLDRNEPDLNTNPPGDLRDTTTPNAMRATMATLLLGDALSPASRTSLTEWMIATSTGLNRLRGGLPPTWRAGDKTGSGGNGAINDLAIIWPPNRKPILAAVYTSNANAAARDSAYADIARLIMRRFA